MALYDNKTMILANGLFFFQVIDMHLRRMSISLEWKIFDCEMAFYENDLAIKLKQLELPECCTLSKKQSWLKSTAVIWRETLQRCICWQRYSILNGFKHLMHLAALLSCCYGMFAIRYNTNGWDTIIGTKCEALTKEHLKSKLCRCHFNCIL